MMKAPGRGYFVKLPPASFAPGASLPIPYSEYTDESSPHPDQQYLHSSLMLKSAGLCSSASPANNP